MTLRFDLDHSNYYNKRMELLKDKRVPKLSDAKVNFGDQAAQVIFQQCDEALREDFGLKNPLQGPGDELWVSPSDLLVGKLALKPPFTPKCLQALTHQGILDVGRKIELRFLQDMEQEKQQALDKLRAELLATIDDRMRAEIKDAEIRERLNCQAEMEKRELEFDLTLRDELDKLETLMRKEYEQMMSKKKEDLQVKWEQRLQEEVENTVERLTIDFMEKLNDQEDKLTRIFSMELRKQDVLREFDAKAAKMKTYEALRQLQHNLECTNLVNMMYVLCTERKNCCTQKQQIETNYKTQVATLQKTVQDHEEKLALLNEEKARQGQDIALRELCLLEIIRQFQKFINFALRAAPTQAEFLLSVEKMLVFELAESVAKTEVAYLKQGPLLSWKEPKEEEEAPSSLEISDHHQCLNELNPPVPAELGINDDLPAIYFKNKLYIREDFRDMLAVGVDIRPSNELWSRDVEILIDTWRKMSEEKLTFRDSLVNSSIKDGDTLKSLSNSSTICIQRKLRQSQVKFIDHSRDSEDRDSMSLRKFRRKSSLKPFVLCSDEISDTTPRESSNILAARDSFELLTEKLKNVNNGPHTPTSDASDEIIPEVELVNLNDTDVRESKELGVETRDSVLLRKISLAKKPSSTDFCPSPKDSVELLKENLEKSDIEKIDIRSRSSKLVLARNSVELLRKSMIKINKDYPPCSKKEHIGYPGICCEQCRRKRSSFSGSLAKMSYSKMMYNTSRHDQSMSVVSFHIEPEVVEDTDIAKISKPAKSNKKTGKISKTTSSGPVYKLKVVGDMNGNEGEENSDQFTTERIHSLINLMKHHPNLLQLFTAGTR